MISYDSYQNRIQRIAAIKNFIVRFRLLFIALAVLIVATIVTLLSITGIVTKDIVLPSNPVYGDTFTVEAPKALMSDAEYQFRYLGRPENTQAQQKSSVRASLTVDEQTTQEGEWTNETPSLAGRYEVRVVTKSGFGGKKYSSPKQFEIESKPVEFLITTDVLTYGTTPDKNGYEFQLANGDRLITEGLTFKYDDPSLDITNICANSDSFVILNSKGVDVTFCYNITTPKKEVTLEQKTISLSLDNASYEYCGAPIDYVPTLSQSTLSSLKGDKIEFDTVITDGNGTVVEAPVNAGTYTVTIQPEVSFFNGVADVSKHYNIEKSFTATFTVLPRKFSITTRSDSKEYDGTPLVNDGFDFDSGLLEDKGHKVVLLSATLDKIDAGEYDNRSTFAIFDGNGNEVTANYEVNHNFGTLKISKREITLQTFDRTKTYDGVALSEYDFNDYALIKVGGEALAEGHTQSLSYANSLLNAGSDFNRIEIVIADKDGNDVTQNYAINTVLGKLTVNKRQITVTTPTDSWQYDGYAHTNTEIDIKLSDGSVGIALADGEYYEVVETASVTYFSEELAENKIICSIVSATFGDVTENYKITYNYGSLSITKRPVTITTPSQSRPYDGTIMNGAYGEILADNLAVTDFIDVNSAYEIAALLYVGKIENTTRFKIYGNSADYETTFNYDITYINGELEITKRDITIHTSSPFKDYDGTPLKGDRDDPIIDNLADFESFEAYDIAERTIVGTTENTTQYYIVYAIAPPITDIDDDYVIYSSSYSDPQLRPDFEYNRTENYNITYDYGTITINKRSVSIITATSSKEYDGTAYSDTEGYTAYGIVDGHTVKVNPDVDYATVTDVSEGSVLNTVDYLIFDGDDDVTENYAIIPEYGSIWRTQRVVQVTTVSDSWIYDGQPHDNNATASVLHGRKEKLDLDYELYEEVFIADEEEPFVLDHKLKVYYTHNITNVGTDKNRCEYFVVDGNEVSVSVNYELIIEYGDLEITKRPIIIYTADATHIYDDTAFSYTEGWKVVGGTVDGVQLDKGLVNDHVLKVTIGENGEELKTYVTDVLYNDNGEVIGTPNVVWYEVYSGDESVDGNYGVVEYIYGTLKVEPRPITIQTPTSSKEFDGKPYSDVGSSGQINEIIIEGSIVEGHRLYTNQYTTVTYVTEGEVDNIIVYRIFYDGKTVDETAKELTLNYAVTYAPYGKISRTKRPVYVLTTTNKWTYDGDEHSDYGCAAKHIVDGVPSKEKGLVSEHTLKVLTYATVKDFSETPTENICTYTVTTKDGNEDMLGNYDLKIEYGELSIAKREIIITTGSELHIYDGEPFSYTEGWSVVGGVDVHGQPLDKGLVKEHTLKVKKDENGKEIKTLITNVQRDADGKVIGVDNVVEYEVYDSETYVDFNYQIIEYKYGTLTVTPRPIIIDTGDASKIYDGTPLYCDDFKLRNMESVDGGLLTNKNHTVALDETTPLESLTYYHVDNSGTYYIEKVALEQETYVSYITYIKEFDGKVANAVLNQRNYIILDEYKNDISLNYNIHVGYGMLKIEERPLTITTPTISKPYDGTYLYGDSEEPEIENLVKIDNNTESYTVVTYTVASIIDVKESGTLNTTKYEIFSVDGAQNTTLCYDITYVEGTLSIKRIPLTITTISATKVYDGTPLKGDDLSYGTPVFVGLVDSQEYCISTNVTSLTDYGTLTNTTEYIIRAYRNDELCDITDNYGDDNGSYINYVNGTLTVDKRTVKIHVTDAEHEYDGDVFTSTEWTYADDSPYTLLTEEEFSHTLEVVEIFVGITDVGEKDNKVTYKVVDKNGDDGVNKNYDLKYSYGKLIISKRQIIITTGTKSHFYDGDPFSYTDGWKVEGGVGVNGQPLEIGLVKEHTLKVKKNEKGEEIKTSITDVQFDAYGRVTGVDNIVEYEVYDGETCVDFNYQIIEYKYGTLKLAPRLISIATGSASKIYDGTPLYCEDFTYDKYGDSTFDYNGLLTNKNHTVELDESTSLEFLMYLYVNSDGKKGDVQKVDLTEFMPVACITYITTINDKLINSVNNMRSYKILDKDNKDISYNYRFMMSYGVLTILERPLTITTPTISKPYDGAYLYGDSEEPTFENLVKIDDTTESYTVVEDTVASIIDVIESGKPNTTKYEIRSVDGAQDTMLCYDITYVEGTLSITEIPLKITTISAEKVYDGKSLDGDDETYGIPVFVGLVDSEEYCISTNVTSLTDCGTLTNTTEYIIRAYRNGELCDITANYGEIDYNFGTLTVTARKIIITTVTDSREFDGKPFSNTDADVTTGDPVQNYTLVDGHRLEVKENFEVPFVTYVTDGAVDNIIEYDIVDKEGNAVNGNYQVVSKYYGKISVTQRKISITTITNNNLVYNGKPQSDSRYSAKYLSGNAAAFAEGHSLEVVTPFEITNVSENRQENNVIGYKIVDENGVDRTGNYAITDVYGTLTMKKLPVEIALNSVKGFTYGGTFGGYPLVDGKMFTYVEGSAKIVDGETLEIEIGYQLDGNDISKPVNAGKYDVVVTDMKIVGGNVDLNNYEVSYVKSSFTVSPREISINLLEVENGGKMYDAVEYVFPVSLNSGYEICDGELVAGDTLTIAVTYLQNGTFADNVLITTNEKVVSGYPVNSGAYIVQFDAENCTLDSGKPVSNYSINCIINRQSFTITQRPLYFQVDEVTLVYTSLDSYSVPDEAAIPDFDATLLADGDKVTDIKSGVSNVDGSPISEIVVGKYKTAVYQFTVMRDKTDVTSNYYLDESDPTKNNAVFEIVKRQIQLSVWFVNEKINGPSASDEYTGSELDLNELFDKNYKSEVLNDEYNPSFGIGENDKNKVEAVFSFTRNGVSVPLIERGVYEVDVTLKNKDGYDVLKNYEIIYPSNKGEFTVTRRQVIVTPKTTQTNIEYNGLAIEPSYFDYDTLHNLAPYDVGFVDDADKEDFTAVYKLYKSNDTTKNLLGEILQVGTYKLAVELTYKAGISEEEKKYDIVEYRYSAEFTVSPRTIYVQTFDDISDVGDYVYDKTVHSNTSKYTFVAYRLDGGVLTTDGVFCNGDGKFATPVYDFVHETGISFSEAVYAGNYTIKISSFTGVNTSSNIDISENYIVKEFPYGKIENPYGKIAIRPAKVLVVPLPYSEKYKGVNVLEMPKDNYSIEYVEGSENNVLFGDDKLSVTFSGNAKISAGMAMVRISSVAVDYSETVADGIENYEISYTYSQLKNNLPDFVGEYTFDSFLVELSFEKRTLKIAQLPPPEQYKQVEYGTVIKIKLSGVNFGDYVLSDCEGLIDGHSVSVGTTVTIAEELGTIKNWLDKGLIKITDESGVNVTNGYDITVVYEGEGYNDTYIEVVKRNVEIKVNFAPSGIAEGSVLSSGAYSIVSGSFIYGDKITVTVSGGKFVYQVLDVSGENDRSEYYNVTFTYPETENINEEETYASWI